MAEPWLQALHSFDGEQQEGVGLRRGEDPSGVIRLRLNWL